MRQCAEVRAKIVRPQQNCQDALPKAQVQIPDGEKPSSKPEDPRATVRLELSLFHVVKYTPLPRLPQARSVSRGFKFDYRLAEEQFAREGYGGGGGTRFAQFSAHEISRASALTCKCDENLLEQRRKILPCRRMLRKDELPRRFQRQQRDSPLFLGKFRGQRQ